MNTTNRNALPTLTRARCGILAAALWLGWLVVLPRALAAPTQVGILNNVQREVEIKTGRGPYCRAARGVAVRLNDYVRTGRGASAEIIFADSASARLRPLSIIRVTGPHNVAVVKGQVFVRPPQQRRAVWPGAKGSPPPRLRRDRSGDEYIA